MNIKPLVNTVYLKDFKDRRRLETVGEKRLLVADTFYDPTAADFCVHEATIHSLPLILQSGNEVEVKEGDRVLCHHFVTDESCIKDIDGERLSELYYDNIYAKYNDKVIEPIHDYVFIEPIEDKFSGFENGLFVTRNCVKNRVGKLRFFNKDADTLGLNEGDTVIFKANREYEMKIDDVLYYRMKLDDIEGVLNVEDVLKVMVK